LHSHWDASQISSVSTFDDQQDNNDLSSVSDPQLESSGLNNKQTVLYDGTGDVHQTDNWDTTLSPPNTIYLVFELASVDDSSSEELMGAVDNSNSSHFFRANSSGEWDFFNGSAISGGTTDLDPHLASIVAGSSGVLEIDDSSVASGDTGSRDIVSGNSFWLGGQEQTNRFANVRLAEVAVYDADHDSATRTEFWDYASSKWGL
jgi:hypothetical protein